MAKSVPGIEASDWAGSFSVARMPDDHLFNMQFVNQQRLQFSVIINSNQAVGAIESNHTFTTD